MHEWDEMDLEEFREPEVWATPAGKISEIPEAGTRVPAPEVGKIWDDISRWKESSRWLFHKEEHNNILEGRAGVGAAVMVSADPQAMRSRVLLISDSQVVIGVMSKGRSSVHALNHLARRVAAISFATGARFYWRYIRTHRNHADAPSRQRPFGILPTAPEAGQDGGAWNILPESFLKLSG